MYRTKKLADTVVTLREFQGSNAAVVVFHTPFHIQRINLDKTIYLGLILLFTAHKSGLTLKPCSTRPIIIGNEPPKRQKLNEIIPFNTPKLSCLTLSKVIVFFDLFAVEEY